MAEYKTDEGKQKEVCSILKAVLTSFGGELPMNQIDSEYRTVVGSSIPYKALKHGTLASFLQSIPSVLRLQNRGGQLVVTVVNDENINLILQQVKHQDNSKYNKTVQKKKRYTEYGTRQLHANPNPRIQQPPPLLNTRWQNNTNWRQQHTAPWQAPTMPTRPKIQNQPSPQPKWRPQHPQPPPGFRNPSPLSTPSPSVIQGNTAFRSVTFTMPITNNHQKPTIFVQEDNQKTNSPAAEKTPVKKSYKQQLIEAIKELETKQGEAGDDGINLQFRTIPCGKKMDWCTVIMIGDMRVSSYPDFSSSQEGAEEAASKKALEIFPQLAKKKQVAQLPTTTDYTTSVSQVVQLLKEKSPNKPFWWEILRDMYCEVYNERLPQHWMATVKNSPNTGLVFANPCVDKWTVALADESTASQSQALPTAKPQNTPAPAAPQKPPVTSSTKPQKEERGKIEASESEQKLQLPSLGLPTTPTWDVFITCVEDGNTVKLLLVGEQYSGMLNELQTEMELHYMEDKNLKPVKEPVVGEIYVANHEESWHRVELMEVMDENVKVKFVDHGDTEDIPLADLHYLQASFFSLPPQALQCCLDGLEDAPKEATFQALIDCLPMGRTLVARVTRRQEPYSVVLFDTTTNDDINLNEKVFGALSQHLVEPSLPPVGGLAEVYLTHASSKGTLYVQVESKTYKILEDLVKIARRSTEEILGEKIEVDLTKLYLARFSKDEEWYRAAPKSGVDSNGQVLMRFVDFGNSEKVPLSNIRGLQKTNPLLAKIPHQAMPCCLHNVPNNPELKWTVQACQRLMELAPAETKLLLKVVSEGTASRPPFVQLFKIILPQKELVSINDTLGMDTSLFVSEGDSNNNSVGKEVVLSQVRSQQSSCASGTSSQSCTPPCSLPAGPNSFPQCFPLSLNDIPALGAYFDVFVTYAANPYHFAVQPWRMAKRFNDLEENMQNYYQNSANLKQVSAIKNGQYCAVKHTDDVWYRAKVEVVTDGSVAGIFVDFGDRYFSSLDKVQPLIPAFCTLPCLAIKAELYGIKAANKDWSPEDACRFRELVGSKNLVSKVHNKSVMNTDSIFLSLELIDTSDKTLDVHIDEVFVNEKRAIKLK